MENTRMRILVVQNPTGMGAFQYVTQGIINALNFCGHTAIRWDGDIKTWTSFKPDLYLGCSGHKQQIPNKKQRGNTLVGIHVNPFGQTIVGSVDGGPTLDEPKETIDWVLQQSPDFAFCYCSNTFIPQYFNKWIDFGIKVIEMPCAADLLMYKLTKPDPQYACDIGWVGGYWGYKAKMLDIYIKPLLTRYNCKIFGWGGWPNNNRISDENVPKLFATAKICPSVSEPHSRVHPFDIPERVFKIPVSGGFTIHSPSPAILDFFGETVPMANDQEHWFELIDYYLHNPEMRLMTSNRQKRAIMSRHTYFDRCANMFNNLGLTSEADAMLDAKFKCHT